MRYRKIAKILLLFFAGFVLLGFLATLFVLFTGKRILLAEASKSLGVSVQAKALRVALPASIVIDGVSIGDAITAEKIIVSPSLLGFLRGEIFLNALVIERPRIRLTRREDKSLDFGITVGAKKEDAAEKGEVSSGITGSASPEKAAKGLGRQRKIYISRIRIKGGEVEFIDRAVDSVEPFVLRLAGLDVKLFRPSIGRPLYFRLASHGQLQTKGTEQIGELDFSGWVDIGRKDMDGSLSLRGVKLAYFEPYYRKFSRRHLASGEADLSASLVSANNNLDVDCHVELGNIAFGSPSGATGAAAQEQTTDLAVLAFSSILNAEGSIVFDFSIHTKMDRPRFENVRFKGTFGRSMVQRVLSKPPQETVKEFKEIGRRFKDIGKEFKEIFKGK